MSRTKIAVGIAILMWFGLAAMPLGAGSRFTDNGDGTVTDHQLNVMWAQNDNNGHINWKEADQWVRYTFPYTLEKRYDNWRLPTLAELASLYVGDAAYKGYETECGQRVKIVKDVRISCGWVWTAEKIAITARVFNFAGGFHHKDRLVHRRGYRVLPVRSLE